MPNSSASKSLFDKIRSLFHVPAVRGRGALLRWLAWFGVANLVLILLISLRYLAVIELPGSLDAQVFALLLFVGHFASLLFIIYLLLLVLPALLLPHYRLITTLAIALSSVLATILFIDTFVYAQYRFHINGAVLNLLFSGAAGQIFSFSWTMYITIGLVIFALLSVQYLVGRALWHWLEYSRGRRMGYGLAMLLVLTFLGENGWYAWADATSNLHITSQSRYLPGYQPTQAKTFFVDWGLLSAEEVRDNTVKLHGGSTLQYPLEPLSCKSSGPRYNVLFIVVDSWRFDALNEKVTPNLHQLSRTSLKFNNHYSGGNATRTGLFTLFYGIPGTYWHAMLNEERSPVFMDTLMDNGYDLGIYASAKLTGPEFDRTIFSRVANLRKESKGNNAEERDRNITQEFVDFVRNRPADDKQPFFGLLFYDAPHSYEFPPSYPLHFEPMLKEVNYLTLNNDSDPEPFLNRYRNSLHFVDSQAGQVLDVLKERGLMDNTVVVVTGDHAQEFNDNKLNFWGHNGNFSRYQTQVPLVIHWPGRESTEYQHVTSHMDITPTLLQELFGCANPAESYSVGKSLLDTQAPKFLMLSNYSEFAVMEPERTSVVNQFGQVEVMDGRYRPLTDAPISTGAVVEALQLNSRFLRN